MPTVIETQTVSAPYAAVFGILSDMEAFPRFMKSVESVIVLERGEGYTVSQWKAHIRGGTFQWVERDEFYPQSGKIAYRQISGDLKTFQGCWRMVDRGTRTDVTLETEFEFGVPMLAALLNPVGKLALRENARAMLTAIGERVAESEKSGAGES